MYGHGFIAWVSYHRLAMRLPFNKIVQLVEDSFGEHVTESTIHGHIVSFSGFYKDTEKMFRFYELYWSFFDPEKIKIAESVILYA